MSIKMPAQTEIPTIVLMKNLSLISKMIVLQITIIARLSTVSEELISAIVIVMITIRETASAATTILGIEMEIEANRETVEMAKTSTETGAAIVAMIVGIPETVTTRADEDMVTMTRVETDR